MEKRFNVTGTCIPEMHYMVDTSHKIEEIMNLVKRGEYFTINRPRQFGKTTSIYMIERLLEDSEEYMVISISFEGIGDLVFEDENRFSNGFISMIVDQLEFEHIELAKFLEREKSDVKSLMDLSKVITKLINEANKKVILVIDEVDKSSNNQLFLSFLGMLRQKYLLQLKRKDHTFHSIILAGVYDVKSLKLKLRPGEEEKYNSPWNIAVDFDIDMSFSAEEIKTMLDDYVENKGVELDKEYFSEKLYYYTSGYPFLVSKLCKIIDEKIMIKDDLVWNNEYMDMAVKRILQESNTNFDSLIKNIENNKDLKELVKKIVVEGMEISYNKDNPLILQGTIYGIFKNYNGKLKIHNRVYEQRIYAYMASLLETSLDMGYYNEKSKFIKEDRSLDMKKILIKFQEFMKHERSEKRQTFLEADGRLVFLAFISPIINGKGFAFKEVQGAEERRFDIVLTYEEKLYIIELKKWYGEEYHKRGLAQLGEYLDQYGIDEGYLLVFDFRKETSFREAGAFEERVAVDGKEKNIVQVFC